MRRTKKAIAWTGTRLIMDVERVFGYKERHRGVVIVRMLPTAQEKTIVFPKVRAALDVLARYEPRQLDRMLRYVRYLVIDRTRFEGYDGAWMPPARCCAVDVEFLCDDNTSAEEVAVTIVHEVTHAWLYGRGVEVPESDTWREERVCYRASRDFARRLPNHGELVSTAETTMELADKLYSTERVRKRRREALQLPGTPPWALWLYKWLHDDSAA